MSACPKRDVLDSSGGACLGVGRASRRPYHRRGVRFRCAFSTVDLLVKVMEEVSGGDGVISFSRFRPRTQLASTLKCLEGPIC